MRAAVVGGGISGLVAAYRLRRAWGEAAQISLFEQSGRLGGVLRTVDFAGGPVDLGAEAFIGRRPEVPELLTELGLADQLVHPSGLRPVIRSEGRSHPLPAGGLMGLPGDAESLRGLVDDDTLATVAAEVHRPLRWNSGADLAVGSLVAERFGEQVVQRSVDPMLGGVYAGLSSGIGLRAALPTLAAALDAGATSLTEAVRRATPPASAGPVFGGVRDGYRALLTALRGAAAVAERVGVAVTELRRVDGMWSLGAAGDFDAVILATPADVTARLLAEVAPDAARAAAQIPLASSALVALALPQQTPLPSYSGILVATGEPLRAKAFTFSSRKWPHMAGRGSLVVRASFGRHGDDAALVVSSDLQAVASGGWSDATLIAAATADLAAVVDLPIDPLDAVVQRWPGGLPQYLPGHLDRVARIEAAVAEHPGLAVTGAYLRGVGVPACVAAATAAARRCVAR